MARRSRREGDTGGKAQGFPTNPFSPVFGGSPKAFFGRSEIIVPFQEALESPGSDYRTLFITGVRALGKTALVERLSRIARGKGWDVFDLSSDRPIESLIARLAPYDELTRQNVPSASLGAFGLGGMGTVETRHVATSDLCDLFVKGAANAKEGILVTIDEIQKLALEDDERICSAFQMASRKGSNVALVVAGLPYARANIVGHDGCTFMQRARWIELELLSHEEVRDAFASLFGKLGDSGATLGPGALCAMVRVSKGQPYLMQLIGYELVRILQDDVMLLAEADSSALEVTEGDVDVAFGRALAVYEKHVLDPLLNEAKKGGRAFLQAMATSLGEDRRVRMSAIASVLERPATSLSSVRKRLIDRGIITAPERGVVRFNVPYLQEYLISQEKENLAERRLDEWGI